MKYTWSPGPKLKLEAQVFGDTIARLAKGRPVELVPPADIVEEAKKPRSPIHGGWDWDVHHAAELHWREVARGYVQRLCIVRVLVKGGEPVSGRALYSIASDGERGYATPEFIRSSSDLTLQVLEAARRDLQIYLHKYGQITHTFGKYIPQLNKIVDEMSEEINALSKKAAA